MKKEKENCEIKIEMKLKEIEVMNNKNSKERIEFGNNFEKINIEIKNKSK